MNKQKYPWINAWKLRFRVSKIRRKIVNHAPKDSWIVNLPESTKEDDNIISPAKTKHFTATTTNIDENIKRDRVNSLAAHVINSKNS